MDKFVLDLLLPLSNGDRIVGSGNTGFSHTMKSKKTAIESNRISLCYLLLNG